MPSYTATFADAIRVKVVETEITHLTAVRTLPGVVILRAAARNGPGSGQLQSQGDGAMLAWQAPGSATFGTPVDCSSDGTYLLRDGDDADKWVRVQVYVAHLLPSAHQQRVYLADRYANGPPHDDVTAAEATAGDVVTYQLRLYNESPVVVADVDAWVDASVSGLEISDDGASWSTPTTEETALDLGSLAPGDYATLHLRRTIGAGANADPDVLTLLHYSFQGL